MHRVRRPLVRPGMSVDEMADRVVSSPEVLAYQLRCGDEETFERLRAVVAQDVRDVACLAKAEGRREGAKGC